MTLAIATSQEWLETRISKRQERCCRRSCKRRTLHKVSDKMAELYGKLKERSPIQLQWFIEGRDRDELIAIFLGLLELVRLGGISMQQGELFGDILIGMTQNPLDEGQFAIYDQR